MLWVFMADIGCFMDWMVDYVRPEPRGCIDRAIAIQMGQCTAM